MIVLQKEIGSGRRKVCYDHPDDSNLVVKINHPSKKKMRYCLRSRVLSKLKLIRLADKPIEHEYNTYLKLLKKYGDQLHEIIPKHYGYLETNYGSGLTADKIANHDNKVSVSLDQFLTNKNFDDFHHQFQVAIEDFYNKVKNLNLAIIDCRLDNFVVQILNERLQIIIIDIEDIDFPKAFIPVDYLLFKKKLVRKKIKKIQSLIRSSIEKL